MPVRPKIVVIGAGFAGLTAVEALQDVEADITLLDKRNYHLFQPLLYQVATADLSPADVAWPIRGIFSKQRNVAVRLAQVEDIDRDERTVLTDAGAFDYDYLIVASGAHHSYFGNDHWEAHAPGLKRIIDATEIRKRVLVAFERAEATDDAKEQERCLTFVIVGGGPTGVEMAGAIAELARFTLARDFRRIDPKQARVILVEAGPRLLTALPEELTDKAQASLEKLGVEVKTGTLVEDINADGVATADGFIRSACVIWGAGVSVPDVADWLKVETDRSGRIAVTDRLSLKDDGTIFVVGDAAKIKWNTSNGDTDQFVPGIAPAAKQAGRHAAEEIQARIDGRPLPGAFSYKHAGNLATIGRHAAVIDFGWMKLSGFFAWWLWGIAHIYFLIGVRQPIFVALSWFWSYLTYARGARLITGLRPLLRSKTPETKPPVVS